MKVRITQQDISDSEAKGNAFGIQKALVREFDAKTIFFTPFGAILTRQDGTKIKVTFPDAMQEKVHALDRGEKDRKPAEFEVATQDL